MIEPSQPTPRLSPLIHIAGACFVAALILAHTVTAPLDHNEHAYLGVAGLMAQERLYETVLFNQMPLSVQTYGALIALTGPEGVLLRARLINAALTLLMLALFYRCARRVGAGPVLAWLGVLFLVFNPVLMGPMKEAGSYMLALAATWGAVLLTLRAVASGRTSPLAYGLTGVLLGLSLAAKLYHLAVWPCFLIPAFLAPAATPLRGRILGNAVPLAAGCLIGLLPVWLYVLRDLPLFWFNNFTYHTYDHLYFGPHGIPLAEKIIYIRRQVGLQANIAFLVCLALAAALALRSGRGAVRETVRGVVPAFLLSLIVLSGAASASPNPVWIQHFAFPLPFIVLAFMYLAGRAAERDRPMLVPALAAAVLIAMAYGGVFMYVAGLKALNPSGWTTSKTSAAALWLREQTPDNGKIATLSPLYAVEAGRPIYRELGMGPFLYRTAHFLTPEHREGIPVASKDDVGALLAADPPAAILVGEEGDLDDPFTAFAEANGYTRPEHFEPLGLTLYLKPAA